MVHRAFFVLGILALLSSSMTACIFPLPGIRLNEGSPQRDRNAKPSPELRTLPDSDAMSSLWSLYDCVARGQDLDDGSGECIAVSHDPSSPVGTWQSDCQCGRSSVTVSTANKIPWSCWQERIVFEETNYHRSIDLFAGTRCAGRKLVTVAQEGTYESGAAAADPQVAGEANRSASRRGIYVNYQHGEISVTLIDAETTKAWTEDTVCGVDQWAVNESRVIALDACVLDLPLLAFTNGQSLALKEERSSFRRYAERLRLATAPLPVRGASSSERNLDVDMGEDLQLSPGP